VVEQLERADLLAANERGELGRGFVVQPINRMSSQGGPILSTTPPPNPRHCFARMIAER